MGRKLGSKSKLARSFMTFQLFGQEKITNNPVWSGAMSEVIDQTTKVASEAGRDFIKLTYKNGVLPKNHPMTMILDEKARGISGSSNTPLHKTGNLSDSVESRKMGRGSYEVRIDPNAYPEGKGNTAPYSHIASLMETGYVIAVTERVKAFWRFYAKGEEGRVTPELKAPYLVVPSRPVWDPATEYVKILYGGILQKNISDSLLFHGIYKRMDGTSYRKKGIKMYSYKAKRAPRIVNPLSSRSQSIRKVKKLLKGTKSIRF